MKSDLLMQTVIFRTKHASKLSVLPLKCHFTLSNSDAGGTRGTETSKYPKEEKETSIPEVAASETGRAQTRVRALWGSDRHNGYGR